MYIAVLADNIADRKQTERLLGRANDIVSKETGTLYIDAYGDAESLYRAPMKYELFILDITLDDDHGKTVVEQLKKMRLPGTICVLYDPDNFFDYWEAAEGCSSLPKPIETDKLHQLIRDAHHKIIDSQVPKIEIRSELETYYIPLDDILYANSKDYTIYIHLVDGSVLTMMGEIRDFYIWVNNHKEYHYARKDVVINDNHVTSFKKRVYTLDNGETIQVPFFNHIPSELY